MEATWEFGIFQSILREEFSRPRAEGKFQPLLIYCGIWKLGWSGTCEAGGDVCEGHKQGTADKAGITLCSFISNEEVAETPGAPCAKCGILASCPFSFFPKSHSFWHTYFKKSPQNQSDFWNSVILWLAFWHFFGNSLNVKSALLTRY